jgi:phage shock protein PspC (stress-responsive transcriptional regulator)
MKKTQTVNIGGQVFNIDEDAYSRLSNYLLEIEGKFLNQEEKKEIMADIEFRIGELLKARVSPYKQVITLTDIEEVIGVMGEPQAFSGMDEEQEPGRRRTSGYRRMYRDGDHRVLGGVCSGMAAYWDIDPVLVRILFLIAFFGFGIGFLIYLILWIVIPPARTTAQKLEMRGEAVTFDNIGKFVKEEFNQVKKNMKL